MREVLTETGYFDALEAERTIEAQGRIENLEALMVAAQEYDARSECSVVETYLEELALFAAGDDMSDDEGLVTLMTLHNAKGLEYPIVFIIGVEDGVFPHQRSIEEGDVEEERRLAYVGPDARDARPLHHLRAPPHPVRRRLDARHAQPLPRRDPARAHRRARARADAPASRAAGR